MQLLTEIVHSYDVATRRVRCGAAQPDRSTKHASGVTCPSCRELLPGARPVAARPGAGDDATLGK